MDRNSKLFLRLRQTKAALEEVFYRSLDSSLIRSGILYGPAFRIWPEMGEGRHFQCFRQQNTGGLDLAINLAKSAFLEGEGRQRKIWTQDLESLRKLDHPLVPPMEVIEDKEFFAYIQPCCEADLALSAEINAVLDNLHQCLAGIGLELTDYPQLRSCQGHPFVIDFSELNRLPAKGFKL